MKKYIIVAIGVVWCLFQLFISFKPDVIYLTGQRAIHLFFGLLLFWVMFLLEDRKNKFVQYLIGTIALIATAAVSVHMVINGERFDLQPFGYTTLDNIIAITGIILVLEATRRVMGLSLIIVALVLFAYGLFGNLIPGTFGHAGFDFISLVQIIMYTIDGIFGQILGISTSLIFIYLMFGGFLLAFGGGDFFTKLAFAMVGTTRGGAAKVAVLASAFFGSISGSAISNIVTTGTITIPMMKRMGFKPEFAGGVEAVASTGGQILPPVMGATAFIMADMMGVSYTDVVIAATVPAILYFVAILFMVDFRAAKDGMKGMDRSELPKLKETFKEGWHFFIPFIVLIYLLLVLRWEAQTAAIYAIAVMVIMQFVRHPKVKTVKDVVNGMVEGAKSSIIVTIPCATIGIIVGVVLKSGLGLGFASFIRNFAGNDIFFMLVLMMIGSIIIGMGVPTVAAYVMLAVMMVPSLIELGVPPMAAHMFAMYFGCLSILTPPVALAAYAAAGLANSKPFMTGVHSFLLSLSGFIIPYIFVYQPALMFMGTPYEIAVSVISSLAAVVCLSGFIQNYFFGHLHIAMRIFIGIASPMLIFPATTYAGFGMFIVAVLVQWFMGKRNRSQQPTLTA